MVFLTYYIAHSKSIILATEYLSSRIYTKISIWRNFEIGHMKFQDFSATQILREINFWSFWIPKAAFLTILAVLHFEILALFDIFKCEIFLKINIQSL